CNIGDATISDPVYGVDKISGQKTAPYLLGSIDMMAVSNLPNELPRDASRYFGEQLIKFVIDDLLGTGNAEITRATIAKEGELTPPYSYLSEYVNNQVTD
ncbi:MAG: alanine dehydrogenase, partial [Chitinophagaceae bacterium]